MTRSAPSSRSWIGYFVLLGILSATGIVLPIVYNRSQQLRQEQLDAARLRWRQSGPADYDLTYSVKYDRDATAQRHVVLVRGEKIAWAGCEGETVSLSPAVGAVVGLTSGAGLRGGQDIPAIFAHLQHLLDDQERSGGNRFLVAVFDPAQGWPRRFVWRIRRSSSREEWDLRVWPPGELKRPERFSSP